MTPPRQRVGEVILPEDPATLAEFESLLAYLKQSRGFDFTAYKRSSLMRRVGQRPWNFTMTASSVTVVSR